MRNAQLVAWALLAVVAGCASSGGHRVGVVQVRAVMEECAWAQERMQQLKNEIAGREKILDEQCMTPLQKFAAQLKELENAPDGDPEKRAVLEQRQRVMESCMELRGKLQEDVAGIRDRFLSELMEKIQAASARVAKNRKLDVVLLAQPQGVVSWAGERVDVTGDVKKIVDSDSIE